MSRSSWYRFSWLARRIYAELNRVTGSRGTLSMLQPEGCLADLARGISSPLSPHSRKRPSSRSRSQARRGVRSNSTTGEITRAGHALSPFTRYQNHLGCALLRRWPASMASCSLHAPLTKHLTPWCCLSTNLFRHAAFFDTTCWASLRRLTTRHHSRPVNASPLSQCMYHPSSIFQW